MKIQLQELREAMPVLTKILKTDMDFKLAYRLSKIAKKLIAEDKHFNEMRNDLIVKLGSADKEGRVTVKPENVQQFSKELEDALKMDVELDIQLIPFEVLENGNLKVSPIDLTTIEKFVEEKEQKEEKTEKIDKVQK